MTAPETLSSLRAEPKILTFGCRLNAFESEVMRGHARAAGLTDTVIVNTCAVTAEAERQARQTIRRARRQHPRACIVVTGCAAQIDPQRYSAMPEVDRVIGNEEKLKPESYLPENQDPIAVADIMTVRETAGHLIEGFEARSRAFVQIQQGCDHRCTFCVIPYGRGNNRSVPIGDIVRQVRALTESGVAEVVLTGVDIASFGTNLPGRPSLGQLARRLLALVPDLRRLRLTSLDPAVIDEDLFRLLADEPRLMPHVHLSLQSGDDLILKRMKRRHARADAVRFIERLRAARPGLVLGADLIAGFPTESDDMFDNTLRLVDEGGLSLLHVFPYSPRTGTPAARMPQIPQQIRKDRAALLRAAGAAVLARTRQSHVGTWASVLVEDDQNGNSEHYLPVRLDAPGRPGEIVRVRLHGLCDGQLLGAPLT